MIQETHDRLAPLLRKRDKGFRWRGTDISRIEGLSDAVFAFCITLLVVSLEAPKTFDDLRRIMHGFVSFGACFALLLLIWHSQYIYFRRYALVDNVSFILNAALLFVVSFYVYPLKFLFTVLLNGITGHKEVDAAGKAIIVMQRADWRPLMIVYSAGFIGIYVIFALLYYHAYRLRDQLELNALEVHDTGGVVLEHAIMVGIGALSLGLALAGFPLFSGLTYILIGPLQTIIGAARGRRRRLLGLET